MQVNQVVNEQQLKDEIAFLRKYHFQRNAIKEDAIVEHNDDIYRKSEKLSLLLKWCRSVCLLFGVKVRRTIICGFHWSHPT